MYVVALPASAQERYHLPAAPFTTIGQLAVPSHSMRAVVNVFKPPICTIVLEATSGKIFVVPSTVVSPLNVQSL